MLNLGWQVYAIFFYLQLKFCKRNSFYKSKILRYPWWMLIRVRTIRPFLLNFGRDPLKGCEISFCDGKKSFFCHMVYFPGWSAHFLTPKDWKMAKCRYLKNCWSYRVGWPLILCRICIFLLVFHINYTPQINRNRYNWHFSWKNNKKTH